jgi:hypothetical protein
VNHAMRAVFRRVGWQEDGTATEIGRDWLMYRITRQQWQAARGQPGPVTADVDTVQHLAAISVCRALGGGLAGDDHRRVVPGGVLELDVAGQQFAAEGFG